jgi:hypothetical protein
VKKGDWVSDFRGDVPRIGRVVDEYTAGDDYCINVVLYAPDGTKIGRSSPPMGGPRNFEPGLLAAHWERIEPPHFPLELRMFTRENGGLGWGILPLLRRKTQ